MIFTLMRNEFRKIFRRPKTLVVFVLGLIFTIVMVGSLYYSDKNISYHMSPKYIVEMSKENLEHINKEINRINSLSEEKKEHSRYELDMYMADKVREEETVKRYTQIINSGKVDEAWKFELEENIKSTEKSIEEMESQGINEYNQSWYLKLKQEKEYFDYLKKNDIKPLYGWEFESFGYLKTIIQALGMAILVALLAVFISDIVSGECTPATLKFLLVQPIKRSQVLFSKFVVATVTSVGMILTLEGLGFALVSMFSKLKGAAYPVIIGKLYDAKNTADGFQELVLRQGSGYMTSNTELMARALLVQVLFIVTACAVIFMISSIMNSSMVTMGVSVITLVFATISSMTVAPIKKVAHLLFVNYGDTVSLVTGDMAAMYNNVNMTVNNGIIVMGITIIISYIIAHIVFTKKDILI